MARGAIRDSLRGTLIRGAGMKKSTRALVGLVVLDGALAAGAAWMVWQVRSGAWTAPDPPAAISAITSTAGGAIGIVTAVLLLAFVVHRRKGN